MAGVERANTVVCNPPLDLSDRHIKLNFLFQGVQVLFWFRFTDFEWNYMYYSLTSSISIKLSNEIQNNVSWLYLPTRRKCNQFNAFSGNKAKIRNESVPQKTCSFKYYASILNFICKDLLYV